MYKEFLSVHGIETLSLISSISLVCCTILNYPCSSLLVLVVWECIAEVLYMLRTGQWTEFTAGMEALPIHEDVLK